MSKISRWFLGLIESGEANYNVREDTYDGETKIPNREKYSASGEVRPAAPTAGKDGSGSQLCDAGRRQESEGNRPTTVEPLSGGKPTNPLFDDEA